MNKCQRTYIPLHLYVKHSNHCVHAGNISRIKILHFLIVFHVHIIRNTYKLYCHHKVPRHLGGTDKYDNLILVCRDAHKLIHAISPQTIAKLTELLNLTVKQQKKVDALRSLVHVESC